MTMKTLTHCFIYGAAIAVVAAVNGNAGAADLLETPQLRRPAALAVLGERLYVANRRSGSISVVDLATHRVVAEQRVGAQVDDLAILPGRNALLAVDSDANRLRLLKIAGDRLNVAAELEVLGSPVTLRVAADGALCSVVSLWGRRTSLIEIANDDGEKTPRLKLRAQIDLPFAPRLQWLSTDGARLVVADAFGGRLAAIDVPAARVRSVRSFHGHNVQGMAADAEETALLLAHQILNESVPTTHDRVFWGTVMGNVVRTVPLEDLFSPSQQSSLGESSQVYDLARWSLHPLGRPGSATGDPGAVTVTRAGQTVVALSGVGDIAYQPAPLQSFARVKVGRRPVAVTVDEHETRAYIANYFDDSLSVLELASGEVRETISLGPQSALTIADRGEVMFYDANFSLDGWYSCHSCHTDGHSNGLLNDNFSDDAFGASKRVLSLLGVGDTGPWAWNGGQDSLAEQVRKSITITMRDPDGVHATQESVAALTAYLETLPPRPSLASARGEANAERQARGQAVFQAQGCAECHRPATYTSPAAYDVGLEDEVGRREFNPPSLRGVSQREALFHDNRAASLREVFVKHRHADAHQLPPDDLEALLAFLRSL